MRKGVGWVLCALALGALATGCGDKKEKQAGAKGPKAPPAGVVSGSSPSTQPNKSPAAVDAFWNARAARAQAFLLPAPRIRTKVPAQPKTKARIVPPVTAAGDKISLTPPLKASSRKEDRVEWNGPWDGPTGSTVGRIFWTEGKYVYSCSGTLVNSENQSTVWTAGHCVHGGAGQTFHKDWVFAPGYHAGQAPYGFWPARPGGMFVLKKWSRNGSLLFDLGAVSVAPRNGQTLMATVGGAQGITFNQPASQFFYDFGYPADKPYDGEHLYICRAGTQNRQYPVNVSVVNGKYVAPIGGRIDGPATIGITCDMTGGASGGGWLVSYDGTWGWVDSVNSTGNGQMMWGPYLGNDAATLFNAVRKYQ